MASLMFRRSLIWENFENQGQVMIIMDAGLYIHIKIKLFTWLSFLTGHRILVMLNIILYSVKQDIFAVCFIHYFRFLTKRANSRWSENFRIDKRRKNTNSTEREPCFIVIFLGSTLNCNAWFFSCLCFLLFLRIEYVCK